MQAIAATLEESLCPDKDEGHRYAGKECKHHTKLVSMMEPKDAIITFNYDCLIDETLRKYVSLRRAPPCVIRALGEDIGV